MPIRGSKDVRARYLELPPDLDAALVSFAESRGLTFKAVVVEACQRHLAYPPPVATVAPLPVPEPAPVKTKRASRAKG